MTQQKTGDTYLIPMHSELIALWDQWAEEDRERKVVSADGSDLIVLQENGRPVLRCRLRNLVAAGFLGMDVATMISVYAKQHPDYQEQAVNAFNRSGN